jgi:hypothetical protein
MTNLAEPLRVTLRWLLEGEGRQGDLITLDLRQQRDKNDGLPIGATCEGRYVGGSLSKLVEDVGRLAKTHEGVDYGYFGSVEHLVSPF